jgi:hypothetical protein
MFAHQKHTTIKRTSPYMPFASQTPEGREKRKNFTETHFSAFTESLEKQTWR